MAWNVGGSIRVAGVADAAAIAAVHVEAWRETYVGIVPVQVLAGLSVDRRMRFGDASLVPVKTSVLCQKKWVRLLRNTESRKFKRPGI